MGFGTRFNNFQVALNPDAIGDNLENPEILIRYG